MFLSEMIDLTQLSTKAYCLVNRWANETDNSHTRPSWDDYFMQIAFDVATRSNDSQTQFGTVIVSPTKEILATGYNGTIRNIEDGVLPNVRPSKYDWMIHSEHNAILSCARQGKSTIGATLYVTGEPCINCYQYIWQVGIVEVVHTTDEAHMYNDEMKTKVEIFKALTSSKLRTRHLDFSPK